MKLTRKQINNLVSSANVSAHNFDDLLDLFEADEKDVLDCFNNILSTFNISDDKSIASLIDCIIIGQANDDDEYGEGELAGEDYLNGREKAYEIREYAENLLNELM